jgi:hypothetical protein
MSIMDYYGNWLAPRINPGTFIKNYKSGYVVGGLKNGPTVSIYVSWDTQIPSFEILFF